jgi:hypothetical protein
MRASSTTAVQGTHNPQVTGSPTATRNLYVNSLSVDLVYQDSTDLTKTAIVTGEVVQWVSLPIATVISMLNKA